MPQIQSRSTIQATEKLGMMGKNCHNFNITLLKTMLLNHVTQSVGAEVSVYFPSLNYTGHNTPS